MTQPPAPLGADYDGPSPQHSVPYQPPAQRPAVIPWFVAYAVLMALLYLFVLAAGVTILALGPEAFADEDDSGTGMRVQAWAMIVIGAPLGVAFGVAPFLRRRRWVWIYDLVLICIGMTSFCLLPATIPLLIFWIKPETRAWFT